MSLKTKIGILLKKMRQEKRWTQQQAASKMDVTQAQWSAYELSKNYPSIDTIEVICQVFEVEPKYFFEALCTDGDISSQSLVIVFQLKKDR